MLTLQELWLVDAYAKGLRMTPRAALELVEALKAYIAKYGK